MALAETNGIGGGRGAETAGWAGSRTGPCDVQVGIGRLQGIVAAATAFILMLGIGREIFIGTVGTASFLQDLRHFNLDDELSLPTWYASSLLLAASGLLALIAIRVRTAGGTGVPQWTLLAILFALLSLDEGASFHESLVGPMRAMLGVDGYFYYAWVIPGMIGVAMIGLYFLPFLLMLPRQVAARFAVAGAMFVGGAIGVEMFAGEIASTSGENNLAFRQLVVVEEALEMVGLTIFVATLLGCLRRYWPRTRLVLGD